MQVRKQYQKTSMDHAQSDGARDQRVGAGGLRFVARLLGLCRSRACNHDGGCAAARHVANGGGGSQGGGQIIVAGDRYKDHTRAVYELYWFLALTKELQRWTFLYDLQCDMLFFCCKRLCWFCLILQRIKRTMKIFHLKKLHANDVQN